MTALTPSSDRDINGGMKMKMIEVEVTSATDTITLSDFTTIKDAKACIAGTPETLIACTFSGNVITTTGWSSGTEDWVIEVYGV